MQFIKNNAKIFAPWDSEVALITQSVKLQPTQEMPSSFAGMLKWNVATCLFH